MSIVSRLTPSRRQRISLTHVKLNVCSPRVSRGCPGESKPCAQGARLRCSTFVPGPRIPKQHSVALSSPPPRNGDFLLRQNSIVGGNRISKHREEGPHSGPVKGARPPEGPRRRNSFSAGELPEGDIREVATGSGEQKDGHRFVSWWRDYLWPPDCAHCTVVSRHPSNCLIVAEGANQAFPFHMLLL